MAAVAGLSVAGKFAGVKGGRIAFPSVSSPLGGFLRKPGVVARAVLTGRADYLRPGLARGLARHGGSALAVAGSIGATALADHVGGSTGHAISGIAGGALLGGSIGAFAGPWGAAAGAVIGGAYGLAKGLQEAERALDAKRLKGAFDQGDCTIS